MTDTWTYDSERYRYATRDDLPAFIELLSDPEVGTWLWFTPIPAEGVEAFFKPYLDRQTDEIQSGDVPQTAVFVVEDTDGTFLGQGAVVAVAGSPDGFEIGFQLMKRAWGRGVGTRLGEFLCAYAIERCGAYRIEGDCLEGNLGSAALLKKLGLNLEGARPGYRLKEKTRHTELYFGAEVHGLDRARYRAVAERTGLCGS